MQYEIYIHHLAEKTILSRCDNVIVHFAHDCLHERRSLAL